MDIDYFEGGLYNFSHRFDIASQMEVAVDVYGSDLDHEMTNYKLRMPPAGTHWRRNTAGSDNLGVNLHTTLHDEQGTWRFGFDAFGAKHNSDIDNPNSATFFVKNFNDVKREVYGTFIERQQELNSVWRAEFGARYNRVEMDADTVNGTPAMMMMPAQMLRDAFNSANRDQNDNNVDLVAKVWFRSGDNTSWYAGIAQKYRSPSYQERYLWLPLEATGGLADGYTYTGNINLDPERSHQVELGLDYGDGKLTLSPRIYYNEVDDYIQGTPSTDPAAVAFVNMMNNSNGTNMPHPLQFNNVEAQLYGFDMDWSWQLGDHWQASGLLNYVRGKRDDIDDNLYRVAPPNATFRLGYVTARWRAEVENVLYAKQDNVSETNGEKKSDGYGILNLNATWQASAKLQLAAGVDNVFDKKFRDHLGGYNRAANPDIDKGERLPGYGINAFARLVYEF
jgi:iron complex outermembrane receptor protein